MKKKLINSLTARAPDQISNNYKMGVARIKRMGESSLRMQTVAPTLLAVALATGAAWPGAALAAAFETDNFKITGDYRLRLEEDWDSQKSNGVMRAERGRARVRVRAGLNYQPTDYASFGLRARTGSNNSQQSPHITILDFQNNGDTGDAQVNLDQWYLKGQYAGAWAWTGRNSFPFWKQNELFWDDDVTPVGLAGGYALDVPGNSKLAFTAGYFSLPAGMQQFAGNLAAGQLKFSTQVADVGLTAAAGLYAFDSNPSDPDNLLFQQNNGFRDYNIWVGSVQAKLKLAGRPLSLGADVMHNTKNYGAADLVGAPTNSTSNDTEGYVLSARLGSTKNAGDWLVGYTYARIESFAVNSSFSQDDWVRWGTATQTTASDFKGHEIRGGYGLAKNVDLLARLYLVESINSQQDGKRFRLDLNYKF